MASRAEGVRRTNRQLRTTGNVRPYGRGMRRGGSSPFVIDPSTLEIMGPVSLPPPVTEAGAMALPPFGRGVALLANAVAGTEWWARKWDPDLGIWQRIPNQPPVLTDPTGLGTVWHYKWSTTEDLILYGNHFAIPQDLDENARPKWLIPLPPEDVWVLEDPELGWAITVGGEVFSYSDLIHVSAGNASGRVLGRGVLRQYAETLAGYTAAEDHAASFFYGGALPPAVLQSPHVVTEIQALDLKTKWRAMTNTREPVVLPSGYTLTPLVSSAESSQLVESRRWDAELVAMLLGVPTYKLGLPGPTMTYQNVESGDIEFVRDDVDRWAAPLAHVFTKRLMPLGTEVSWDWAGRMRHDQTTLAGILTSYVGAGILTLDEARATLSRPPLEVATDPGTTPEGVPELTPTEA